MQRKDVSMAVIRRMPKYYRYLDELSRNGVTRISSKTLAESMGLTASQIRQDFNCYGGFGQQGYGYNVEMLKHEIASIIGIDKKHTAVLIGVGNIGHALMNNFDFSLCGFNLLAAFDNDEKIVGTQVNGVPVYHISELESFNEKTPVEIAVLTLPKSHAPEVAELLAEIGVRGIWNFTNIDLQLKKHEVTVEDVHFADSLMTLCYRTTK